MHLKHLSGELQKISAESQDKGGFLSQVEKGTLLRKQFICKSFHRKCR